MPTLSPANLLKVWENGAPASSAMRGLLLLGLACPQATADELLQTRIGQRDAWLLTLRETLFGHRLACLFDCPACGQPIELDFAVDDIRVAHAPPDAVCQFEADGRALRFRLPCMADLLAMEGLKDLALAERRLLQRCWLQAPAEAMAQTMPAELSEAQMQAVVEAMALQDPQAEVLLDVSCPACQASASHLFDIVGHLWLELDHWARGMLRQVHAIAARYGWAEDHILAMGRARRQAYLDLIGYAG
jgi:hypothetical protein